MASPWSREDDADDRMESVVAAYKLDAAEKLALLEAKMRTATQLLRDVARYGAHLSGDECTELARLLDPE